MKTEQKPSVPKKIVCMIMIGLLFLNSHLVLPVQAVANEASSASKFITVNSKDMHIVLYGNLDQNGITFADPSKETLVMLPALAVPSPNIYFKPLAEALSSAYNVVVIEPFGYGLSDMTESARTVENINSELYDALETLGIDTCTLLVHSISGVYGLNFLYSYPKKVDAFIAIDNTVYDEALSEALAMEQDYMLQAAEKFDELRNTFGSVEEFEAAIAADPSQYGAELPDVAGYTYTESDQEEYYEAYTDSSNRTIQNEILNMDENLESIKGVKFPSVLPVLTLISSENVQAMPAWKTAHQDQLDFNSGNHELHIIEGNHYIWYTNINGVVQSILKWENKY